MMLQTAVLDLGNPKDALFWEEGCKSLGISNAIEPIKSETPSLGALLKFLGSSPDWIYFSGHFVQIELYSARKATRLVFASNQVSVTAGKETRVVKKGDAAFGLDRRCKVVVWGGCNVCAYKNTLDTLQSLFGPHVLLGYSDQTGVAINTAMLGGGFIKKGHFFDNVKGHETEPAKIRDAWLQAAIKGYRGTDGGGISERSFRAVDPDGQQWWAVDGRIQRIRH